MRWLGTACLLAGCNQLYGLDKTELIDAAEVTDTDGDGVIDQLDNCDSDANPDQMDMDGDGLGDACDPCPTDSGKHDEDKDGLIDGCDNCPQLANFDQKNDDGDDLGNVCDHDPGMQTRVLFDGFESLSGDWVPVFINWEAKDDKVSPEADTPSTAALWNLKHRADGKSFYVEIAFTVSTTGDGRFGIAGYTPMGVVERLCVLDHAGSTWTILASSATAPLPAAPQGVQTLRWRRDATTQHCELVGGPDAATIDNVTTGEQPGFQSTAITDVYYLDAVSGP